MRCCSSSATVARTSLGMSAAIIEPGGGVVCVNGAAAHLNQPGDLVILATFVELDEVEMRIHKPVVVHVDAQNKLLSRDVVEVAGPERRLQP